MGASLALEVARRLEGIGADVGALVVAGRPGPGHDAEPRLAHLPDAQFADQLGRRYGGIPPEVAASSEIMEMFVPILRADIAMMERYDPGAGPRVRCPLLACAGEGDVLVPASSLRSWSIMTNGQFDQRSFPGGHFFIDERREQVVAEIGAWIRSAAGSNVA